MGMYYIIMNPNTVGLRIYHAHMTYNPPGWTWDSDRNRWTGHHLWFMGGGSGHLQAPDVAYELGAGDCFILRMAQRHLGTQDPKHPLMVYGIHFDPVDRLGRARPFSWSDMPRHRRIGNVPFFTGLLSRCVEAMRVKDPESACYWLRAALRVIREYDTQPTVPAAEQRHARGVEALCRTILRHPEQPRPLAQLAAELGCTPNHAIRLFRRHKQMTPGEFLIGARIDAAKNMLRFSSLTVSEIAYQLGYSDPYFFSKQFKQRTHHAPKAFRRLKL
ncbi:MAG: helix-turn-helix transcriptional regulator [Kiritimatiellae bacterium]|nr:helix-turn-helix transcriptional regulator [Kiritimatiellia bacterium]